MTNKAWCIFFALFLICGNVFANLTNDISLKFQRTGTTASDVKVSVVHQDGTPVEGATATMTSTHDFLKTMGNVTPSIICPNANGNANANVLLTFSVKGLPADYSFNQVKLDVHALNMRGQYQGNNEANANPRQFNVEVKAGQTSNNLMPVGFLSNIEIAGGVGESHNVHKFWEVTSPDTVQTNGNVNISLRITSGALNKGCFFGLSEVALSCIEVVKPEPEPQPQPGKGKVFTISWKNNTAEYMSEEADGSLIATNYDISKRIFWKFIATEKPNCYYIQNTATNRYISSCNLTPSDASLIKTTATPVEYYVGKSTQNNAEIKGCYYFTSTDCENYSNENASPQALNKDKPTSNIITWNAGPNRVGSYWTLHESEDLYEIRPFQTSAAIGKPTYLYAMLSANGKAMTMKSDGSLSWSEYNNNDDQTWYFVGEGNKKGGYLLVNVNGDRTYRLNGEESTHWNIMTNADGFFFRTNRAANEANVTLKVEGDSLLSFPSAHSKLSRKNQVYDFPCGTLGTHFVEQFSITGKGVTPMYYPLATMTDGNIVAGTATRPNLWYVLYTKSKATVSPNQQFCVNIKLNGNPLEGQEGFLYFDWDRDGVFEVTEKVNLAQQSETIVTVPADAISGKTRLRFRLTDNGLSFADDEATGMIFDAMINVTASSAPSLTVVANNEERGNVEAKVDGTHAEAIASPKGNATFICWREGNNILSLDKNYTFELDHAMKLTAYFSPNTKEEITGIENHFAEKNQLVQINAYQKKIEVKTIAQIKKVLVFTPNGSLVSSSHSNTVNLEGQPTGTYIVKVYTDVVDEASKVLLK